MKCDSKSGVLAVPDAGKFMWHPDRSKNIQGNKKRAGASREMSVELEKNDQQNLFNLDVIEKYDAA